MRFGIATTLLLVGLAIATPTITQARSGKNNPIPKVGDDCWEWEWDDWEWEWDCRDRKSQAIATPQEDTEKNNPISKVGDDCWEWEWDDWEWEWDCRDRKSQANVYPREGEEPNCDWEWDWEDWDWDCEKGEMEDCYWSSGYWYCNAEGDGKYVYCDWEWDGDEYVWVCYDDDRKAIANPQVKAEKNKQAKPKKVQFKVGPLAHPIVKDCTESCWESLDEVYEHCPVKRYSYISILDNFNCI